MTDHDADEIVPQRKRREKTPTIDKVLGVTGVALAAFGTFFPWYAFFNQDKFHLPTLWQGDVRDMPNSPAPPSSPSRRSPFPMPATALAKRHARRHRPDHHRHRPGITMTARRLAAMAMRASTSRFRPAMPSA